ncbi:MAG: hypothetical protein L0387_04915 [Acidobacteria bacterium]|nr:hypothetical protein [Acidobacteriota bacterium]MCI0621004.1 hypothetical protein [Acidobacteriota bacterium]MCI0719464.1 hypothetical protein [Acidobacteriota bacterium]
MSPDTRGEIVSKLRSLLAVDPQQAMDELESLVDCVSVRELASILRAVYDEVSEHLGIDWHFTVLQWKFGNRGCEEFLEIVPQGRFTVWSLPFQEEGGGNSETRHTTCLPFQFKPEWAPSGAKAARH